MDTDTNGVDAISFLSVSICVHLWLNLFWNRSMVQTLLALKFGVLAGNRKISGDRSAVRLESLTYIARPGFFFQK